MDNIIFRLRVIAKTFFLYLFYLPGLILHEGSHALMAILTGSSITAIKLFPSVHFSPNDKSYKVVYGYVNSVARFRIAYMLISLAPLLLWLIPLVVAIKSGWVTLSPLQIHFTEMLELSNLWFLLLLVQILWAGSPSSQDWKVFFYGLFSVSTALVVVMAVAINTYFPFVFPALLEASKSIVKLF